VSELRKDPITERWVIISSSPMLGSSFPGGTRPPEKGTCPFCPGNEAKTPPEILSYREEGSRVNSPGWTVRVFAHHSPVLRVEGNLERRGIGAFDLMSGLGANEVFVESPDHEASFFDMADAQVEKVLWAYRDRILDLQKDRRLQYTLVFKNHGVEAGALLAHPHSQLIALPIIPKVVKEELEGAKRYFRVKERCVFCDIVRQELEQGVRLVAQNRNFLTFTPFAPRFPFEAWILPKKHESCFTRITREEMQDLGRILKMTLRAISHSLKDPAYNFLLHIAPNSPPDEDGPKMVDEFFHWHLEIMPRLIRLAGFEWGSGLYFNPTAPEEAAQKLREALS